MTEPTRTRLRREPHRLRRAVAELERRLGDEIRTSRLIVGAGSTRTLVEPGEVVVTGPGGSAVQLRALDAEAELVLQSSDDPGGSRPGDAIIGLTVEQALREPTSDGWPAAATIELAVNGPNGPTRSIDLMGEATDGP